MFFFKLHSPIVPYEEDKSALVLVRADEIILAEPNRGRFVERAQTILTLAIDSSEHPFVGRAAALGYTSRMEIAVIETVEQIADMLTGLAHVVVHADAGL